MRWNLARLGAAIVFFLLLAAPAARAQPPVFEVEDLWPVDEYPSLRLEVGRGEHVFQVDLETNHGGVEVDDSIIVN